jgi:hypothetical protein
VLIALFEPNPDYHLLALLVKVNIGLRIRDTISIFIKRELRIFCEIEINAPSVRGVHP